MYTWIQRSGLRGNEADMNTKVIGDVLSAIDDIVWGPIMLVLLVGTGIFLTIRTRALCIRNLPYAIKSVLSKEARQKKGDGDVSPFSALTTALAATIGTGNIVGVATAMVSGGPGALVWMWISAVFGLTSKFSECMLAIKYREVNEKGEMSGGPMYTMKKALKHKKFGAALGWFFALFAVIASFGIGNLTQANSISTALFSTFHVPLVATGIVITVLALFIIIGGIKSISKVSQVVVPLMAVFYIIAGLIVIIGNIANVPAGLVMIFKMAFSIKSVGGGLCGALVASMGKAIRFGVARGIFSNEAGMGSAAITAAAASTNHHVRQGYINMTGTFWDTIVVCTITGICIASSGVLGATETAAEGTYRFLDNQVIEISAKDTDGKVTTKQYDMSYEVGYEVPPNGWDETAEKWKEKYGRFEYHPGNEEWEKLREELGYRDGYLTVEEFHLKGKNGNQDEIVLHLKEEDKETDFDLYEPYEPEDLPAKLLGDKKEWTDADGNQYTFEQEKESAGKTVSEVSGSFLQKNLIIGSPLTILAFKTVLNEPGGYLVCIGIVLFAFSTILGWEYHGEKAFEYLLGTHKYNMIYRIFFSLIAFVGATTTLEIAWTFSDIANALMAIPNLICMLILSGEIAKDIIDFQKILKEEKKSAKY